jgi:putative ABC transport system permease protein
MFESSVRFHELLRADVVLIHTQSQYLVHMEPFSSRRLYQAAGLPGVDSVSTVDASITTWEDPTTGHARVIFVAGFDPDDDVFDVAAVREQRAALRYPDVVLFDAAARPEYGPVAERWRAGATVTAELGGRTVTIVGLFAMGTSFGVDGTVITSNQNFRRIFPHRTARTIDIGLIHLVPGADAMTVRNAIDAVLPGDVEVLSKAQYLEREKSYWRASTPIGYVFTFGAIMGLVVGAVIVYQILFADISGHLPEYATLKAMGYPNRYLFSVVIQEAIILAVLGFVPGLLLCSQLYRLTAEATRLPMELQLGMSLLVLTLTVAMCCVAAAVALRKVRSADPAEIF